VVRETADYLEGHIIPGHPYTQQNVQPPPTIASIAGQLLASIHNPNTIWDAHCHRVAEAEIEATAATAELIGYDAAKAGGVFTFGGTGTILYGIKIAIEKALPGAMVKGVREPLKVIAADASHYAKLNVLGWLGIGTENLVTVPTDEDNSIRLTEMEAAARRVLDAGQRLAAVLITAGTTDAFGIDNIEYAVRLRDRLVEEYKLDYRPHVHVDAVIGWAFAVFNDYDFDANPMGFPPRALRCLWDTHQSVRHLHLADSIGVDFHKTGYTPYVSSLFLCKDQKDLTLLSRSPEMMPYLFQYGNYHPGEYTLETSRAGGSMLAAIANLKQLGKEGYRVLLGHTVAMAEHLRQRIEETEWLTVLNDYNYGPVTLFRVYPPGVNAYRSYLEEVRNPARKADLHKYNDYTKRVFAYLLSRMEAGDGVALSQTDNYRNTQYGEPIVAVKSFVMSPFVDEAAMETVIRKATEAHDKVK
jgi:glutamate/tyrosine decarboxylase-like PLP-dependent enzyme